MLDGVILLIKEGRQVSARTVDTVMTATYWLVGRHIVEFEQQGNPRAPYGGKLLKRMANDLNSRFQRGFDVDNLQRMRRFYLAYASAGNYATVSRESDSRMQENYATVSRNSLPPRLASLAARFPLPWSAYVRLLSVQNEHARRFYETEALRGGWGARQLDRQIDALFYERTALSKNKAKMLNEGAKPQHGEEMIAEEHIKNPYVLEFLGLKDEYSENDIEEALILHLERFLLELGGDFTFVGRQRRLRVGDEWYRIDLLFFHRRLRCLIIIDLKRGKFTHADAGQMHLYLNYAREHWTLPGENPPVGLILCTHKDESLAHYALEGLPNKVLTAEYRTTLPEESVIAAELDHTRRLLEVREKKA
ncbi:MAG: PDDEXK nuclease domain-containing protein [bacterium]